MSATPMSTPTKPTRRLRSLAAAACLALVATHAQPGLAADAPRRPLAESLSGDAKSDYDAGKLLFEDGDFAGAASKFRQAYERSKEPRLLWNVAVCEKGLRHYARVHELTKRYLDEGKDLLTPEQDKAARDLRDAVKSFIGTLRITAPAGAEIAIDGERVGIAPLPAPVPIDLGAHKVSAQKAGLQASVTSVEITGGEESHVTVILRPLNTRARISVHAGEGDVIAFDGTVMASTRWQAEVDAGQHTLRVTAPSRKPYDARLDLAEGATRTVDVSLESEGRPLWQWIAGGVVLAGAASVGGYFLFKPDPKPGEQTPGTLPPGLVNLSGWSR